jgi:hypothetical protein
VCVCVCMFVYVYIYIYIYIYIHIYIYIYIHIYHRIWFIDVWKYDIRPECKQDMRRMTGHETQDTRHKT